MKRIIKILFLSVLILTCNVIVSFAQGGFWGQVRTNIHGDWGFDLGVSLTEGFGLRAGMMTDFDRKEVKKADDIVAFKKVLGNNYRLSYSIGPMVKIANWLWLSATAGYGEIGTYAYNSLSDVYGISGKIKGLEVGLQLQFRLKLLALEIGYGTLPNSFALGRPYHDVTFGLGIYL